MSKKRDIKDFPSFEISVRVYDTTPIEFPDSEEDTKEGLLVFSAFHTDISDGDNNPVGSIGGGMGSIVITEKGGAYYMITHEDLWYALIRGKESADE